MSSCSDSGSQSDLFEEFDAALISQLHRRIDALNEELGLVRTNLQGPSQDCIQALISVT